MNRKGHQKQNAYFSSHEEERKGGDNLWDNTTQRPDSVLENYALTIWYQKNNGLSVVYLSVSEE
jgi:hypothetical protein